MLLFQSRLREKGVTVGQLKQELDLLQTLSICESLDWAKNSSLQLLEATMEWQTDLENTLEECGINMKIADDSESLSHTNQLHRELLTKFKPSESYLFKIALPS